MITDELKKQIESTIQLENITQAFEQSAALYLFKTKNKILKSRKFFIEAWATFDIVKQLVIPSKITSSKKLIIAISPNQGMYGNLMWKLIDKVEKLYQEQRANLIVIGKKGKSHFSRDKVRSVVFFELPDETNYPQISEVADAITKYSQISIVYPRYISLFEQEIVVVRLNEGKEQAKESVQKEKIDTKRYLFDPNWLEVAGYFDKAMLSLIFYGYFSESMLAYKAAQMVAMKKAYDNAKDNLVELKFKYSRMNRELIDSRMRELLAARKIWEKI